MKKVIEASRENITVDSYPKMISSSKSIQANFEISPFSRAEILNALKIDASKYFDIYVDDYDYMRAVGFSEDDMLGYGIGSEPYGYKGYEIVAHAVAKDKYYDVLSNMGYDLLEVYYDGKDMFLGVEQGRRLYNVEDEIISTI